MILGGNSHWKSNHSCVWSYLQWNKYTCVLRNIEYLNLCTYNKNCTHKETLQLVSGCGLVDWSSSSPWIAAWARVIKNANAIHLQNEELKFGPHPGEGSIIYSSLGRRYLNAAVTPTYNNISKICYLQPYKMTKEMKTFYPVVASDGFWQRKQFLLVTPYQRPIPVKLLGFPARRQTKMQICSCLFRYLPHV